MRRWISLVVAVAMMVPAVASVAEAAIATWLSPQPGQILTGGKIEVAVGFNTQSNVKVTSLELYVDGRFTSRKILRTPVTRGVCSFWWDTAGMEQGAHNLVVKVYADEQVISKVFGTGTVAGQSGGPGMLDVQPPVVTFANIKAGDVLKGTTTVKLNAVDDSGKAPMVSLLVDDVLKLLKNTPPYTYDLDTTTYTDGEHSLKTYAYDGAGNRSDPSVIKVAFRNGMDRPVVTTMTVKHDPEPVREAASVSTVVPPSITSGAEPSIKRSAARAESRITSTGSATEPAAVVEPKSAPKVVEPAATAKPVKVAIAAPSADVRKQHVDSAVSAGSPAEPSMVEKPRSSDVRHVSASSLPETRSSNRNVTMTGVAAEPAMPSDEHRVVMVPLPKVTAEVEPAIPDARSSEVTRMAMASPSSLRSDNHGITMEGTAIAPEDMRDLAVVSSMKSLSVSSPSASIRSEKIDRRAAGTGSLAVPDAPVSGKVSKSDVKRVRVALAPDIRGTAGGHPADAVACPPQMDKPTKARIEKSTMPANGKVKARTFFENMGGVLFWDPSTHTVTACIGNMVLEMRIGSKTATVNGHEMKIDMAPYLANGRTIVDAGVYARACSIMEHMAKAN